MRSARAAQERGSPSHGGHLALAPAARADDGATVEDMVAAALVNCAEARPAQSPPPTMGRAAIMELIWALVRALEEEGVVFEVERGRFRLTGRGS